MKIEEMLNLIKQNPTFECYFNELVSFNEKVNLTAITEHEDVFVKHFLDSVLPIDEIKQNASVVDVGTGAGFPGVPIKIVRDDIRLTLVDSLNKRINFLDSLKQKLNLEFNSIHARAEDFCKNNREKFDVAVARAVARLNTLCEYLLPLIKVGGIVLAYKGSSAAEETIEAKNAINLLGGKIEKTLSFNLPNHAGERNLIIIKKIKPTPTKYPRGQNQPKIKPII